MIRLSRLCISDWLVFCFAGIAIITGVWGYATYRYKRDVQHIVQRTAEHETTMLFRTLNDRLTSVIAELLERHRTYNAPEWHNTDYDC